MDPYGSDDPHPDPSSGLEDSMWRLGLGGGGGSRSGGEGFPYPERPGERDCAYYLRTGTCGYGDRCRFNHPIDRRIAFQQVVGAGRLVGGEYPERHGQALCEHYLKTGTCKFGSSCKYHHPRQGNGSVQPVSLNYYGYPLRPGEEECSYYMKTGKCKFGLTCKFHHPLLTTPSVPSTAPIFYDPTSVAAPQQYPEVGGWQFGSSSSAMSGAYMPSSYGHIVFQPGLISLPAWSTYLTPLNEAVTSEAQHSVQVGPLYGPPSQLSSFAPTYAGLYSPITSSVGPSTSAQQEYNLPQRPGQQECQFYMKTGECKFGVTCKYHHPLNLSLPATNLMMSPHAFPFRPGHLRGVLHILQFQVRLQLYRARDQMLRPTFNSTCKPFTEAILLGDAQFRSSTPEVYAVVDCTKGAQLCSYYAQHGVCKFGSSCKFNHPTGSLGYSSAS